MDDEMVLRPKSHVRTELQPQAYTNVVTRRFVELLPSHEHEAAALAALIEGPVHLPPHHDVHLAGKPATEALVLLDGLACQYRMLGSSRRQITGFVTPGDFCDFGFLSASPVRQCVTTLGLATIGRIDLARLASLANTMPTIVLAGMRAASIQHASAQELIISLGTRDALQRLAHLLCEIYVRLEAVGHVRSNGQFDFALTQSELGEALGLSNVHVNRTVQQLRRGNYILIGQGQVTMLDYEGLAKIAAFNPDYLRAR